MSELFQKPAVYSVSASHAEQAANGTEWERMVQIILGPEVEPTPHVKLGVEYMYNAGFVPMILPAIAADRSVDSRTLIVGGKLTF